jgi:hypothetical protein
MREVAVHPRRRIRRARRCLAAGGVAVAAVALLAATGVAAPLEPRVQRESLPGDAQVSYTVVDPLLVAVGATVAGQGSADCFGPGRRGGGCQATIGELVRGRGAALGTTANYSDGVHILGLAVIEHQQLAPADPHTTSLCVGDAPVGQRPPVTVTKDADATRCRTAVSGERVVAAGVPAVEGLADDGQQGRFWWSVQHFRRVERTLVGVRADGTVLVAVATAARGGVRNGMTVPEAAAWLVAHGVVDAIALDGGHQADLFSAQHGSQVPLERGEPTMQMALLLGSVQPAPAAPSGAPVPQPAPSPAPQLAAPGRDARRDVVRLDGVRLGGDAARRVLDVAVGAPARPESGVSGGVASHVRQSIEGGGWPDLDARWLAAARVRHALPDLDLPTAEPAMPETGVRG